MRPSHYDDSDCTYYRNEEHLQDVRDVRKSTGLHHEERIRIKSLTQHRGIQQDQGIALGPRARGEIPEIRNRWRERRGSPVPEEAHR